MYKIWGVGVFISFSVLITLLKDGMGRSWNQGIVNNTTKDQCTHCLSSSVFYWVCNKKEILWNERQESPWTLPWQNRIFLKRTRRFISILEFDGWIFSPVIHFFPTLLYVSIGYYPMSGPLEIHLLRASWKPDIWLVGWVQQRTLGLTLRVFSKISRKA